MSNRTVRKQFYLRRQQNLKLEQLAKQRGISQSAVIRQALQREADYAGMHLRSSKDALESIITYARSLRNRPELLQGNPEQFNREELYEDRTA